MNYQRIYDSIIYRAKSRKLDCYVENHHIIPKCMGGSNEPSNIVSLTPEEHLLCHTLLVRIYRGHNFEYKLAAAVLMMCRESPTQNGGRTKLSLYGNARRQVSKAMMGKKKSPETIKRMSESKKGRPVSDEQKEKLSNALKKHHADNPRTVSNSSKEAISKALTGRTLSLETKQKIAESMRLRKLIQRMDSLS